MGKPVWGGGPGIGNYGPPSRNPPQPAISLLARSPSKGVPTSRCTDVRQPSGLQPSQQQAAADSSASTTEAISFSSDKQPDSDTPSSGLCGRQDGVASQLEHAGCPPHMLANAMQNLEQFQLPPGSTAQEALIAGMLLGSRSHVGKRSWRRTSAVFLAMACLLLITLACFASTGSGLPPT